MKKLTLLASLIMASNCFAAADANRSEAASTEVLSLKTYKEVVKAVVTGNHIRVAMIMKNCTMNDQPVQNPMFKFGYFTPNEIILTNGDTLVASMNHFTKNDLRAAGKPAYQYVTYTFTPDNYVRVGIEVLDAASYTTIVSKEVYDCKLGVGVVVL